MPAPGPGLPRGEPAEAGLTAAGVRRLVPAAEAFLRGPRPAYPGFVLLAARHGTVVEHVARGHAVRYASWDAAARRAGELPAARRVPMTPGTVFDIASLSKLFTALAVVRLAEYGTVDLDAPVSRYLPGFGGDIAVHMLLTHTSGLPPTMDLGPYPDRAARLAAVCAVPPRHPPGSACVYSDLNLIAAGALAERVTGAGLDELVAEGVTGPLGMTDTRYRPPPALLPRIAATEDQPWTGRGMLRGDVHDENAHRLGGVAGHAGVFSTARDLAVLGQAMLNGGSLGGVRVLGERWVRAMLADRNRHLGPDAARGLGWQLNQPGWMGDLASPTAFGHTGFTGTSLLADPRTGVLLVLLTNRVHPTRERGADGAYRAAVAQALARAVTE